MIDSGDTADIAQGLVEADYLLILQHLLGNHLYVQRRFHDRRVGLGAGGGVGLNVVGIVRVGVVVFGFSEDSHRRQRGNARFLSRFQLIRYQIC